ncbi:MAG: flagellar motor switch protein FliN [Polaromonas sp.]|uniref:flagellar motor switch protein FliN n=1 Tax=Polaromonas sp. TaxID=1869339 RepID=UPI00271EB234|nr:flagellar motor switch protein FliN [Polaromonas sp.]MDO9116257.1 flagellar motor switch protein FliN [Polaromonas sp.]MDP1886222.1 flagellar motor switch protein FliN [Polaromonas sp.]
MSEDSKQEPAAELDDWGSALAEQALASAPEPAPEPAPAPVAPPPAPAVPSTPAGERVFQPLQSHAGSDIARGDIDRVLDVPVQLTAELGRTRITIKSLLQLSQGSVVELDGLAGQPMDVFINGYLIAQGEVVVVNDKFGIRLTDIITPSERMQKLNR